ncbi:hypothetical protein ACI3KX_02140 [Microbacterium sp. ZW CA_36]|uniref:hypothetical protein n=1 Tax=Microbacterium sp. ZW CA_36 TaxID=3378078 RepID=UPI003853C580
MKRRAPIFVLALLVLGAALTGCAQPSTPAILDRQRTAVDELPADLTAEVDAETSRYVGEDSTGNRYWVVRSEGINETCIILLEEDTAGPWSGCGGAPIALTIGSGLRVGLADYPDQLSESNAELVGDTLLVGTTR